FTTLTSSVRRGRRPRRHWGLRTQRESWALFVWSERRRDGDRRGEALPGKRLGGEAGAEGNTGVGGPDAGADGRPEVLRPGRGLAARYPADLFLRRVRLRRGPRLRRLLDPWLAGDLGVGHAADARRRERRPRPVHAGAPALARLRDRRPDH